MEFKILKKKRNKVEFWNKVVKFKGIDEKYWIYFQFSFFVDLAEKWPSKINENWIIGYEVSDRLATMKLFRSRHMFRISPDLEIQWWVLVKLSQTYGRLKNIFATFFKENDFCKAKKPFSFKSSKFGSNKKHDITCD